MIYIFFVGVDFLVKGDVILGVIDFDFIWGCVLLVEFSFFCFFLDVVEDVFVFCVILRYWLLILSVGVVFCDFGVFRFMFFFFMVLFLFFVCLCLFNIVVW